MTRYSAFSIRDCIYEDPSGDLVMWEDAAAEIEALQKALDDYRENNQIQIKRIDRLEADNAVLKDVSAKTL